jgi:large subunit ribosomal protein L29
MKDRENQAANLRQMSDDQLGAMLREACQTLFRMRMLKQSDRLDVPTEMKRNRRLIARIKTIEGQRKRAAVKA